MIQVDGILGPETVTALQGFLHRLGWYQGDIDGVLDGVKSDGRPSLSVTALQRMLNEGLQEVTIYAIPGGVAE